MRDEKLGELDRLTQGEFLTHDPRVTITACRIGVAQGETESERVISAPERSDVMRLMQDAFGDADLGMPVDGAQPPPETPASTRKYALLEYLGAQLIGARVISACMFEGRNAAYFSSLVVARSWRDQGFGADLFATSLEYARRLGVECVILDTDASTTAAAHHLFQDNGFVRVASWPLRTKDGRETVGYRYLREMHPKSND